MKQSCALAVASLALAATASAQSGSITTLFTSNNGGSVGGMNYFDADILNAAGLTITKLDVNTSAPVGTSIAIEVYTVPGTSLGNETNMAAWTSVSTGNGSSNGTDVPTPVDVADFLLAPGNYGIGIRIYNGALRYTNGAGTNNIYVNADVLLDFGTATNVPFTAPIFKPRVWNGTIYYEFGTGCTGNPAIYCTAKVNSAGCTPAIVATGTPSASAGSGFVLTTTNELDDKLGLYFYSKTGANNAPFQGGTLCGTAPLVRTPVQNSGGTSPCGGAYTMDFNTYVASGTDPALVAGQQVWVQTWSRDPASPSTTNLSDAITFTICP